MALPTNKIKKIQTGGTTYDIVPEMLQNNGFSAELPTLTQNSTIALTSDIPSGGGSGGITEISTQTIRIYSLDAGIYKLTYLGNRTLYYNGNTGTQSITIRGYSSSAVPTYLYITAHNRSNSLATTIIKSWFLFCPSGTTPPSATSTTESGLILYSGRTGKNYGTYKSITLDNLLTSHRTLYQHNISATISWKSSSNDVITYLHTTIINSSSTAYTASTFASYIYTNFPSGGTTTYQPTVTASPIASPSQDTYWGYITGINGQSATELILWYSAIDTPSAGSDIRVFTTASSATSDDGYISYFTDKVVSI